jgi:hypothetical protein
VVSAMKFGDNDEKMTPCRPAPEPASGGGLAQSGPATAGRVGGPQGGTGGAPIAQREAAASLSLRAHETWRWSQSVSGGKHCDVSGER